MKSWRTTLAGLLSAVATVAIPIITGGSFTWASLCTAAGVAAIGYLAKDKNVTGGSVQQ